MTEVTGPGGAQGGGNVVDKAITQAEESGEAYKEIAGDAEQTGKNDMAYYLKLQRAMMQEQQAYTAVSNIMNARKEAALNAINKF